MIGPNLVDFLNRLFPIIRYFNISFRVDYFDEAYYADSEGPLSQEQTQTDGTTGESPPSSHTYIPPILSIKNLKLTGVTLEVGQGPNTKVSTAPDPRAFGDSSAYIVGNDMYRCSLEQGNDLYHRLVFV